MNPIKRYLKKQTLTEEVIEAGDNGFPLIVDTDKDVTIKHELVGKQVQINHYAQESLLQYRGQMCEVTGVVMQNEQITGLKIKIGDQEFYGPKKDFYIERQYVEDIYNDDAEVMRVLKVLERWQQQRDYYGPSWDGIELFYLNLASVVLKAAVEAVGWYKYPSSMRDGMDGKDWRLIFPIGDNSHGVVNCHSMLHDGVWTLTTTIFSTNQIDRSKLKFINHEDIWTRSMLWCIATSKALETDGYDYSAVRAEMTARLQYESQVVEIRDRLKPTVIQAYRQIKNEQSALETEPCGIAITKVKLKPGQISRFLNSSSHHASLICIHPSVLRDMQQVEMLILAELIHASMNKSEEDRDDELFNKLADAVQLPQEYRE